VRKIGTQRKKAFRNRDKRAEERKRERQRERQRKLGRQRDRTKRWQFSEQMER
jgi:hypothetical protein